MAEALILSGGTGTRFNARVPKQYIEVYGRPVISYCIEKIATHEEIDGIWIVADRNWYGIVIQCLDKYDIKNKFRGFSSPGKNRQLSIFNGLREIKRYAYASNIVLIHDAARPMLTAHLITDCIETACSHDGAIPVLPVKDTVYQSMDGEKISALVRRSEFFVGQAPEAFKIEPYYEANRRLYPDRILEVSGSTEPAVMAGMDIAMIQGDERNFKITTKEDMERFKEILRQEYGKMGLKTVQ